MTESVFDNIYNPDVLLCLANLSNDEVFTSPDVANLMLNMLPQDLFKNPNVKFLDPVCKTGVFLRETAKRLIIGLEDVYPDLQERVRHIFQEQLYGIAITELTSLLSRRSVYCSKYANGPYSVTQFNSPEGNIRFKRISHYWVNGSCQFCGASKLEYNRSSSLETHAYELIHTINPEDIHKMKFDVIIGNPPYQLNDGGGNGSSAKPIYNLFVEQAIKLNPKYLAMIIPSRWYTGGKGLDGFRESLLNDKHLTELHDFIDAKDCFPGTAIEGGVCFFLRERERSSECKVVLHSKDGVTEENVRELTEGGILDVLIRNQTSVNVLLKTRKKNSFSFSSIVFSRNAFKVSNDFEKFISQVKTKTLILGRFNGKRVKKYLSSTYNYTDSNHLLDKYKLFVSKADGAAGQVGNPVPARIIGKTEFGLPGDICTETFLVVGPFANEKETLNCAKFLKTKFARFLIGIRKTKNMTQETYKFLTLEVFSDISDIDWGKDIKEIDKQLYLKYELNDEEVGFIDKMITDFDETKESE